MRKCLLSIFTFVLLLIVCASMANAGQPRVIVVIAGSTSIRDFADPSLPELSALFDKGSAGLMNIRAGRPSHDAEPGSLSAFESGCLSLGASAMATGGAEIRRAGDADSTINGLNVRKVFEFRMNTQPGKARILHTEIARMRRINESASYRAKPGALGSALRKAGIHTAVIGNSDIPGEIHREAVTAAMDNMGIVDYGEVDGSKVNTHDPNAPYGIRANPEALLKELDKLPSDCRFIVIDFGDTFRADNYAQDCTNRQAAVIKKSADERLSKFVGKLAHNLDSSKDLLIVLSPNARAYTEIGGERLGAILITGPGFGAGELTSPSTRRRGVVTLADVAPTVLSFFNIKPGVEMVGRPMSQIGSGNAAKALLALNATASAQADRQVIMRGSSIAQSMVVVLVLAAIFFTSSPFIKKIAEWLIPIVVVLPLAMLILPLIYSGGMVGSAVALILLTTAILGICALILCSPSRAFIWLCAIIVIGMMIDLLRGAPLMVASIASYNIVEGARYYGIGNELMGTILGAAIIGLGMAIASRRSTNRLIEILPVIVFGAVFVFVAAPGMGAKVGGALAMAPAMAATLLVRRGWRLSARGIALVLLITVVAVGAMFAVDALHGGAAQSHAGRVVGLITGGNAAGILDIFQRKLALNFMLVVTSVWSRLLGLCVAGSALLLWWGRRERGNKFMNREESAAALGCFIGVVAAFIFNDSGVVAGATCSVFLWAMLAFKCCEQWKLESGKHL